MGFLMWGIILMSFTIRLRDPRNVEVLVSGVRKIAPNPVLASKVGGSVKKRQ